LHADTWCRVYLALGVRGRPARLASAIGQAGLQPYEPSVCRPGRRGLFSQPLGLETHAAGFAYSAKEKNIITIIFIVIVNKFFKKNYYCRNFG